MYSLLDSVAHDRVIIQVYERFGKPEKMIVETETDGVWEKGDHGGRP